MNGVAGEARLRRRQRQPQTLLEKTFRPNGSDFSEKNSATKRVTPIPSLMGANSRVDKIARSFP